MANESGEPRQNGFFYRLRTGGFTRVIEGHDLHVAIATTILLAAIHAFTHITVVKSSLVSTATPLAFSLIAFILTGLAILISFSDEEFLALLKDLKIYNNIVFTFEYNVYLTIIVSVAGIIYQSYDLGAVGFFVFTFLFLYMLLSVANLVAMISTVGSKKARIALLNQSDED